MKYLLFFSEKLLYRIHSIYLQWTLLNLPNSYFKLKTERKAKCMCRAKTISIYHKRKKERECKKENAMIFALQTLISVHVWEFILYCSLQVFFKFTFTKKLHLILYFKLCALISLYE